MPSNGAWRPERIVVIGVAHCQRVAAFAEAAHRIARVPVETITYLNAMAGRCVPPLSGSLVRLESPGGCFATTQALLSAGIGPMEVWGRTPISSAEIANLESARGEMVYPLQWFLGFREILRRLQDDWLCDDICWMSRPTTIATTFDKLACLERWQHVGLPVPRRFAGISSYEHLRASLNDRHARLMVKLRFGYSAVGAMALEWRGPLVRAITTMETISTGNRRRLFVSKRPRLLNHETEIAWLFDRLAQEDVLVEAWLPKARWRGQPFDVRAVVINGRLQHVVGRANSSPFTNLNLDATRISQAGVEELFGAGWSNFQQLCERAASCLPGASVLGVDVLPRPGCRHFTLLEANAFGDYLPGLLHRHLTTYEAELYSLVGCQQVPA